MFATLGGIARAAPEALRKKIAFISTVAYRRSHGQHFLDRLTLGYTWGGAWQRPRVDVASIYVAQPRKRGYLRAMTEAGCTPVTATGSFFYESGAAGVDELLQQDPGLTAIFAMSDEMGAAVVNELQRRGLRVPEDVSVLGFDNTSTSLHVNPPLSTMAQPLEEMGRMAVKKLLRSRDLGPKIMPHRLIERGSTAPPNQVPADPAPPGEQAGEQVLVS